MKPWSTYACLLFFLSQLPRAYAQAPVYKLDEVDAGAHPRGGSAMLETFLTANVRKPFMAQVANITGPVILKATIEPNGQITDVAIQQSLRPDCDREALRVMRLFNAWQPALKNGRAVRQAITLEVPFKENESVAYEKGYSLRYFYQNDRRGSAGTKPAFVLKVPVDTLTALPTGEAIYYRIKNNNEEVELFRAPLRRQAMPSEGDAPKRYLLGNKPDDRDWIGTIHLVGTDGLAVGTLPDGKNVGQVVTRDEKGMVTSLTDNAARTRLDWYPSGLIATEAVQGPEEEKFARGLGNYRILYAWDTTGREVVRNGNGQFTFIRPNVKSYRDTSQLTTFTESGAFLNGYKDGIWRGYYADSSYMYQERFQDALAKGGQVTRNGVVSTYQVAEESPEFEGGINRMYQFLSRNIVYPADAMRFRKSGTVYVSFTVCTDGSLCDFEVVKGVSKSLDEEAVQVVKKMNRMWLPGTLRGEPVRVNYVLPVAFSPQ